jgi:hypothetical protein
MTFADMFLDEYWGNPIEDIPDARPKGRMIAMIAFVNIITVNCSKNLIQGRAMRCSAVFSIWTVSSTVRSRLFSRIRKHTRH